ncbi:phage tail protein [Lentzea sp. NPDC005914]|uniref:phage tail protein n=1 Tax=Lentzea sp. NPDC005914 TaxID=3154572 RepID=UPI0033F45FC5
MKDSAHDPGWLLAQLPVELGRDEVVAGFVRAFEEIADSVRDQVDDIEHELDVNLASPEMLGYLASWVGLDIDVSHVASQEPNARAAQRRMIKSIGQALVWRGTRRGVETLLEALTDSRVDVVDSGGVFGPGENVPSASDVVVVELDHTGLFTREQVLAFIAEELPAGIRVDLRLRSETAGGR